MWLELLNLNVIPCFAIGDSSIFELLNFAAANIFFYVLVVSLFNGKLVEITQILKVISIEASFNSTVIYGKISKKTFECNIALAHPPLM